MAVFSGNGAVGSPSFTFSADTNTGMYRPAADTLSLVTAGSDRIYITDAGNVGIGTTSPAAFTGQRSVTINGTSAGRLDLRAGGGGGGNVSGSGGDIQVSGTFDSNVVLNAAGNGILDFRTQTTSRAQIDKFGNAQLNQTLKIGGTLPSSPNITLNSNGDITGKNLRGPGDSVLSMGSLGVMRQSGQVTIAAPRPSSFSITLTDLVEYMASGHVYYWAYNSDNILNACFTGIISFTQNPLGGGSWTQATVEAPTQVGAVSITSPSIAKSGTWDITISGSYTGNAPMRVGATCVGVGVGFFI